jgi:hypothetical protein|tara:strand:+ start:1429 stop:1548 length:120 start_codon:yes stop_codon:yes gene_type:complete
MLKYELKDISARKIKRDLECEKSAQEAHHELELFVPIKN